jgi:hypothetical protein
MKVNNNENEEGSAQSAAGACRIFERQCAYGETAGLELLKRITFLAAMSARISYDGRAAIGGSLGDIPLGSFATAPGGAATGPSNNGSLVETIHRCKRSRIS